MNCDLHLCSQEVAFLEDIYLIQEMALQVPPSSGGLSWDEDMCLSYG